MIYLCLKAHSLIVNAFLIRSNLKTIVFKLNQFPHLSETFILSQIITAIHSGFDVKLLVTEVLSFEASKQTELLEKYNIADKIVVEDYDIPKNKIYRFFKWCSLLITNSRILNYIIRFNKHQDSFSLTWLFQLVFYDKFAQATIFHIQYGTNKTPLDVLKKIDFIKSSLIVSFHGHDAFFPINGFIPNNGYYDSLFASANAIVANTPYLAKIIEGLGCPSKILKTIPVGVDTSFFTPKKNIQKGSKTLDIITVGRLSLEKGHIYALEVIKLLKNKGLDVHLRIVGDGQERSRLEQYIIENNLSNYVTLEGGKSQREVRDLLRCCDLFLFTSVALEDGRRETQGLATIEAAACGLPAVVFDSGGVKYTIRDKETGYIVPEFNVGAMVSKVEHFNFNRDLLNTMGNQAVAFISETYSHKMINRKWDIIYNNNLERK